MLTKLANQARTAALKSFNQKRLSSSVNLVDAEKLFQYTKGRWLYNEFQQNQARYVRFDPLKLMEVACKATGIGPCTNFTKLDEDSYNKTFRLTLDNSLNVIARIPSPLAGPSHQVIASEVATQEFVREVLKLPVPRVIASSRQNPHHTTNVGTDFIIVEEAHGVPLHDRWSNFPPGQDEVGPILLGILDLETKFDSLRFSRIGSLYFKEDVSPDLHNVPLLSGGDADDAMLRLSQKYCIGPLTDPDWWRGERAQLNLDRGPWQDPTSFFTAMARNEQIVLAQQSPSMNQYRRKPTHDSAYHMKLLSMYIDAVPHLIPTSNDHNICAPTLWHPDLSRHNIFVADPGPAHLKDLVNWHHTAVLPYFIRPYIPPALVYGGDKIDMTNPYPEFPSNFDELSAEEQAECRLQHRFACRQRWYQGTLMLDFDRRSSLESHLQINELVGLPTYVTRAWGGGAFELRKSLMNLWADWKEIVGHGVPCPIDFSFKEIYKHKQELKKIQRYNEAVEDMKSKLNCSDDGWVACENYDSAKRGMGSFEESWDAAATGSPFPFKDGEYSYMLSC